MSHHDDWVDMPTWPSLNPPAFFGTEKSSFQGMNFNPPPRTVATRLADSDSEAIDWTDCAIAVEFDTDASGDIATVHQFLSNRLQQQDAIVALIYDYRSGEAADFIALARADGAGVKISLYHCKGAGEEGRLRKN